MKLKNKKTGKIVELDHFSMHYNRPEEWGKQPCSTWNYSLAELNSEWEDYVPAEPIIKDEKIRKAVRAWVDLYGYKFVTHRFYSTTTGYRWSLLARETQEICLPELDGLDESKDYTIAELCGEEEE